MFRRAGLYGVQGSFGSFLMPNMRRSTNPMNPFALSTTTFMPMVTHLSAGRAGGSPGCTFSRSRRAHALSARPCADQQRTIMTPSATMMTAATNNVNPEGLMLARIMPRPKAAAHTARWRRSARQPCRQNFGLRKTGTSVSRKCRNVLHGTAPRASRAYSMVLALTPSACRARRSRSRC